MKSRLAFPRGSRTGRRITGLVLLAAAALVTAMSVGASAGTPSDGLGIQPGKIKHVWLIILENKSYDASFTGLNNNTYLWKTLPSQGALLTNYYGTGHFSLDNYVSQVSGQATQPDTRRTVLITTRCPARSTRPARSRPNPNYGQLVSSAGPNAAAGTNGCVYPASVTTLFNQLDAAHVSWKGYAQDLGNPDASSTGTLASPGTGQTHCAGASIAARPTARPVRPVAQPHAEPG
jgi:phospholipase C